MSEIEVNFSPGQEELDEIECWLKTEMEDWDTGLFGNWRIIKLSFQENELAVLKFRGQALCFAALNIQRRYARIELIEIAPSVRRLGLGTHLLKEVLKMFSSLELEYVNLDATDLSISFWDQFGFVHVNEVGTNRTLYLS